MKRTEQQPTGNRRQAAGQATDPRPLIPDPFSPIPNPQPPIPAHRPTPTHRRGVLLLVVLSLLVLFALIGVTFVLVASQHLDKTRMALRDEQYGDDPRQMLDSVFAQCIRDTTNPHSMLRTHSLLRDMYGNDGIKIIDQIGGQLNVTETQNQNNVPVRQLIDITFPNAPTMPIQFAVPIVGVGPALPPVITPTAPLSLPQIQTPGYFNGCVLTMVDGAAASRSTRIVGWGYDTPAYPGQYVIRVLAVDGIATSAISSNPPTVVLINGRPFNGTGFGFNPNLASDPTAEPTLLNAEMRFTKPNGSQFGLPFALFPNPVYADPTKLPLTFEPPTRTIDIDPANTTYTQVGGIGGADEEHDAADPQNMLLAHLPLAPTVDGNGQVTVGEIIPSLHRPAMNRFVFLIPDVVNASILHREIARMMSLRPLRQDHEAFPGIDPAGGPFDVDNDGDGIRESVWVDVGLGVRTAPDGRTYKPLAAILCIDLDGRLNVNAHGSMAHVDSYYQSPSGGGGGGRPSPSDAENDFPIDPAAYGGRLPILQRGQGYGPAEISLFPLFSPLNSMGPLNLTNSLSVYNDYRQLLAARYAEPNANLFDRRRDGTSNTLYAYHTGPAAPALAGSEKLPPMAGSTQYNDLLAGLKLNDYSYATNELSSFGSRHNLWGRGFPFLDVRGTPLWLFGGTVADMQDHPYEMDLSRRNVRESDSRLSPPGTPLPAATPRPHDSPFTVAELERVLRMYDLDAGELPDRLRQLVDPTVTNGSGPSLALLRGMLTTDSFDVPAPSFQMTREMRAAARGFGFPEVGSRISDLLRLRLQQGGFPMGNVAAVNNEIRKMLPPELIAGLRMDINRPFGNGYDDDGDGIVDEPGEAEPSYWWATARTPSTAFQNVPSQVHNGIDVNGDGTVDAVDSFLARQLYARHLYVLMMMLRDSTAPNIDFDGNTGNDDAAETARGIAQWAINVVDFRDRDSIMTPFEYTINPFQDHGGGVAWTADGDLSTTDPDTGVVWGCERPELLITETLAYHDRRTEDLVESVVDSSDLNDSATMAGTTQNDGMPDQDDNDFDQRLRPFGPFFVELHNPWSTLESTIDVNGQPTAIESPGEFHALDMGNNKGSGVLLGKGSDIGNSPIWRMIVVKGTDRALDPDDPVVAMQVKTNVDRAIYFRRPVGINDLPQATSYYPHSSEPPAPLLPGRYAVVGSAGLHGWTNIGAREYVSPIGRRSGGPEGFDASTRRIVLTPNTDPNVSQVEIIANNSPAGPEPTFGNGDIQPAIAVALRNARTSTGQVLNAPFQFSAGISEPKDGYDALILANAIPGAPTFNPSAGAEGSFTSVIDRPLDDRNPSMGTSDDQPVDGVEPSFAMIHLQRLADPTQAWNADANPYRTIDSMSIDLAVFNGVGTDADPDLGTANALGLGSYQRGDDLPAGQDPQLWRHQPLNNAAPPAIPPAGGLVHNYNFALQHSLGYLNSAFGTPYNSGNAPMAGYVGAPQTPAPWLTWNNRPFVGPMELLLVPRSSSSRLLFHYNPNASPQSYNNANLIIDGHLLNFFRVPTDPFQQDSLQLHRIFDYLQVPSRYVGTDTVITPTNLVDGLVNETELFSLLRPPFNRVSNYRDPGRVNINTIPSDEFNSLTSSIWRGILNTPRGPSTPDDSPAWNAVLKSRQGVENWSANRPPSAFANPVRSAAGASLLLPGAPGTPRGDAGTVTRDEVDVTLMRPAAASTDDATDQPLFDYNSIAGNADNPTANPYFRIQNLQRVSNLVTTRSNVYAIWITIGFFEVEPADPTRPPGAPPLTPAELLTIYPDGYWLKQELGSDTGEITRHRAFYIYDRTIPVGFEPGQDHNFEEGLLLRRFIE